MGALKDLWQSERGLVAIALIAAGTVLCAAGVISADQWISYTQWVFGIYVAGKTITGTTAMLTSAPVSGSAHATVLTASDFHSPVIVPVTASDFSSEPFPPVASQHASQPTPPYVAPAYPTVTHVKES